MQRVIPFVVLLGACGATDDTDVVFTQTTQALQDGSCDTITETVIGADEATPETFTPNDTLAQLESTVSGLFEWPDASSAGVTTMLTYDSGDFVWIERDVSGAATASLVESCVTGLEMPMQFTISTTDYAFDEAFDLTLQATDRDIARLYYVMPSADLAGAWTPELSGLDLSAYTTYEFEFEGEATDAGTSGTITVLADPGDGVITRLEVGSWAPPASPS
jgi:hypothetical protein